MTTTFKYDIYVIYFLRKDRLFFFFLFLLLDQTSSRQNRTESMYTQYRLQRKTVLRLYMLNHMTPRARISSRTP